MWSATTGGSWRARRHPRTRRRSRSRCRSKRATSRSPSPPAPSTHTSIACGWWPPTSSPRPSGTRSLDGGIASSVSLLVDPPSFASFEELERVALACTKCPLATQGRSQVVFGDGDPHADLVFVGEGPGAEEDRQGIPFVGRAGK